MIWLALMAAPTMVVVWWMLMHLRGPWPDGPNGIGPAFRLSFAWIPTLMEDGEMIWLEPFYHRLFERGMSYDLGWENRRVGDPWVEQVGIRE